MPTAETYQKHKTTIWIAAAILLTLLIILIAVYISARNKGRKQGSVNVSTPVTDTSGAANVSTEEIARIAVGLHNEMAGANVLGHDLSIWNQFLSLSNHDIVRVYNGFNEQYQVASSATLTGWVNAESTYSLNTFNPFGNSWSQEKVLILQRLQELNLK